MVTRRKKSTSVPTLHAVAELAGVSTATVSKALNGLAVSPENYEKVVAAAESLGYVANESARAMRGGRTATIGIVMHIDLNPNIELMAVLQHQISDFEREGLSVLLSVVGRDTDPNALLRRLLERRVDGLVYWNALEVDSLAGYRRAGIPVLAVGYRDDGCAWLPLVTVDGSEVFDAIYAELKMLGHRRVAEVSPGQSTEMHRAAGRAHGVHYESRLIDFGYDSARAFMNSLLVERDAPTAIFASYPTAVQLLAACEELQIRVPSDISIVSMTDSDGAALLRTPLSAVRMNYERLGHATAEAMFAAMSGSPIGDVIVPDCLSWIDRGSLGARKIPRRARA